MGLFAWLPGDQSGPAATADIWYQRAGSVAIAAGMEVTPESAMHVGTVYGCTSVISETLGAVSLDMYERIGETRKPAPNHPLQELLHDQPNRYQTALEWREMITAFALLRGRGISEIIEGPRGPVDQIKPLHPDLVKSKTLPDGTITYEYRDPLLNGRTRTLLDDQVFILRGRFGLSIIELAAQTIGLSLAMEHYASNLFARGARPSGVLQHTRTVSDTVRENLRKALDEYGIAGSRNGRPLLLEDGMTWQTIGMTSQEAEFLALRQFSVNELAGRWFRVPPHKIGELTRSTNNNIEQQSMDFQTDTLMPWAERWEQSIRRDLILAKARFFASHNLDALVRANIELRFAAYAVAIQWGWMSPNDVRTKENLNPIDGGDVYQRPLNMTPLGGAPNAEIANRLRLLVRDGSARAARKETAAIAKLAVRAASDPAGFAGAVRDFYAEHAGFVAQLLRIPREDAAIYGEEAAARLIATGVLDDELDRIDVLTHLAHDRSFVFAEFSESRPAVAALLPGLTAAA
jgi:HK97 family phage portal protein